MQAPILVVLNFSKAFTIETDASDVGIGAVLMQDGHPISYLSKALSPRNQALSTYEKEWRPYLYGQKFVIKVDHKSLLYLTEQGFHY